MNLSFDAVIFDFDGVLANTAADIASSVNAALTEFGFNRLEDTEIVSFVGDGARLLLERALDSSLKITPRRTGAAEDASFDFEVFYRWYVEYYRTHSVEKTTLYSGIAGLLELLQIYSVPAAIVSNKPLAVTQAILDKFDIAPFFTAVVGPEQLERIKPAPDGLILALDKINAQRIAAGKEIISPARTLMVGDSATDIQAGRAFGSLTCAVTGGFGNRDALSTANADITVCLAGELMVYVQQ